MTTIMKSWMLAFAALFLALASQPAHATVQTPIGEQVAAEPGLDAAPEAEAPAWTGADASSAGVGPTGSMGIQTQYTENGQRALGFHNNMLMPLITAISLLVLVLLLYAMVRFRRSANPEPSRTTHHTWLEVAWTILPVIALLVIAVPSIGLIRAQYDQPPADVTVKVIGNQWYWEYEYPDHGGVSIVSNMLKEEDDPSLTEGQRFRTDADGPALLAVDERLVVPAGAVVKLILTSNDVIHSFAVPAFWIKMDTVPGRLNETWFKVDKPGVYFGQCSELCGARHAYMPIAVEVVEPEQFAAYIASKGGTMPGATPAAADTGASDDAAIDGTPADAEPTDATPAVDPTV